jgi:hypothetical protein
VELSIQSAILQVLRLNGPYIMDVYVNEVSAANNKALSTFEYEFDCIVTRPSFAMHMPTYRPMLFARVMNFTQIDK